MSVRFSLRFLLFSVVGLAIAFAAIGYFLNNVRIAQRHVNLLQNEGAYVAFDYQESEEGLIGRGTPRGAVLLRRLLGDAYFNRPISVSMDNCKNPNDALRHAQFFKDLKYLSFKGPQSRKFTDEDIPSLTKFRSLRVLTLSNTAVTGAALVDLD